MTPTPAFREYRSCRSIQEVTASYNPDAYNPDDYLTTEQVAHLWKMSPRAVRAAIQEGRLPALRVPTGRGAYLIHKRDAALRPTNAQASPGRDE